MRRLGRGIIAKGLVASVVAVTSFGVPAGAASSPRGSTPPDETHVEAKDFSFDSADVRIGRGDTVVFDFVGPSHHTATDGTGMDLYDSGSVGAGGPSTSFAFEAAGTYRFVCTPHVSEGMVGRVGVPMRVSPKRGGVHRRFTATWASQVAPAGFVYDVQIRRPGKPWTSWRSGTHKRQASYVPTKGKGTYRFRARLRRPGSGKSLWSAESRIRVG